MVLEYYKAARHGAAILEQDWLGALRLTGPDRTSWLQGMVTNDVARLSPGQGCYAAHLNAQGKLVAQMNILVEPDAIWIVTERTSLQKLAEAFDKLIIMEDVQVQNVSEEYEVLGVLGPDARSVLEAWLGEPLSLDGAYTHRHAAEHHIVRSDLGYDVWVRQDLTDKTLRAIAASGATAIDHGTWDVLRTEAGLPIYGVDIDESTTLPELGERGISYDKGCYIGQEVVARVKYIGHVTSCPRFGAGSVTATRKWVTLRQVYFRRPSIGRSRSVL
jgi:folate-binding protein YgfZ